MPDDVMTQRQLNRALLARQLLLRRAARPVLDAIEHLVALQAQEPAAPYFGLSSRLEGFKGEELSRLIEDREAVRLGLLRWTMHLVSARDAPPLRALLQPAIRTKMLSSLRRGLTGVDVDELAAAAEQLVAREPRTLAELRDAMAERWPHADPQVIGYAIPAVLALVQVPPRGLWGRSGGVRVTTLERWLDTGLPAAPPTDQVVRRYLRAFGPASVADMRTWSGLAGLRDVFERLRPELRTFHDERGRELFDVPDGLLPDPDTPAPPRLLPDFDNAVLGHDDRSRIISDEYRRFVVDGYRFFLIDGMVRGRWRLSGKGANVDLTLEPFESLAKADRRMLDDEAERALAFARTG